MPALSKGVQQESRILGGSRPTGVETPIDLGRQAWRGLGLSYADGIYEADPEVVSGAGEEPQDPVDPGSRVNHSFVCCFVHYQVLGILPLRSRSWDLICRWNWEFAAGFISGG